MRLLLKDHKKNEIILCNFFDYYLEQLNEIDRVVTNPPAGSTTLPVTLLSRAYCFFFKKNWQQKKVKNEKAQK